VFKIFKILRGLSPIFSSICLFDLIATTLPSHYVSARQEERVRALGALASARLKKAADLGSKY
jgi:hypothetical protein